MAQPFGTENYSIGEFGMTKKNQFLIIGHLHCSQFLFL